MDKPYVIAYYLPQFHPFKENDEWWGKGFTEWTNVGKAKPFYRGQLQPRVPADLGYYDLRLPKVREQQVILAKEAGVSAFCYWHYWFGIGRQLMNDIIDEVANTGQPDFPFCLGWANESWKAKVWNTDGLGDRVLMKQEYGGLADYRAHYEYVREKFKNKNYVRVGGRPFFLIYKPNQIPDVTEFITLWNKWVKEDKIADGVYFVAHLDTQSELDKWLNLGFNAGTPAHLQRVFADFFSKNPYIQSLVNKYHRLMKLPKKVDMENLNKHIVEDGYETREDVIPFIMPQWDHTPRSGSKGYFLANATPEKFKEQVEKVLATIHKKHNKLIILKSWNEWGEGNFMEPDLIYGKGFIKALNEALNKK